MARNPAEKHIQFLDDCATSGDNPVAGHSGMGRRRGTSVRDRDQHHHEENVLLYQSFAEHIHP